MVSELTARIGQPFDQSAKSFPRRRNGQIDAPAELQLEHVDLLAQVEFTRKDHFCGSGRRGSTTIRDEIRNGEIDLVPNRRNDRNIRSENRPRHHFFIESPQILQRYTAATDDYHIDTAQPI